MMITKKSLTGWQFPLLCALALILTGCGGHVREFSRSDYVVTGTAPERGMASWYGGKFHGRQTASGEKYNQNDYTAAHKTLPFGTVVAVKNLKNGRDVIVQITDRGPFVAGRIIDVSKAAAIDLDMIGSGVAPVDVYVLRRR
jgi:rare lipoprotein A